MIIQTEVIVTSAVGAAIIGSVAVIWKHISNEDKHPNKKEVVYRDVCEAKQDCLETEIRAISEKVDTLQRTMQCSFDKVCSILMKE